VRLKRLGVGVVGQALALERGQQELSDRLTEFRQRHLPDGGVLANRKFDRRQVRRVRIGGKTVDARARNEGEPQCTAADDLTRLLEVLGLREHLLEPTVGMRVRQTVDPSGALRHFRPRR